MNLTEYCQELAAVTGEAGEWVSRNTDLVRNEQSVLLKELRRAGRIFRRCARAAARKMCVGVFGPSQAGKSYLISALARDESGSLLARFGDATHDFVRELNPTGGKESTGLVTRFTMTRPASLPAGFPVQLRLLSETDIVKIIANSYFADCEHKDDPESDIDATLTLLEARTGQGDAHIDLDAMEDLREYLKEFRAKARAAVLEQRYWERALELGPCLSLEDRVRLYALIWDEVPELTELLRRLLQALAALGQAEEAFCPPEALLPRETSIIDVATLDGLSSGKDGQLTLVTPAGLRAELPRSVVTALTAELTIVMEKRPDDYFEYTDLLDFPGYRSREKYAHVREELQRDGEKGGTLRNMFLRGKVAYLFQRYCTERELTSMLLCIGSGPQEVKDLPGAVSEWIASTHGTTPEARQDKQVSLFFILTKSDMEFEQKAGDSDPKSRWDNRLHASLLDFFGLQGDWPRNWDGRPFNNIFLLRNPNYRFTAVLDYDGDTETGITPAVLPYVTSLKTAFLQSPLVAEHFRNPQEAWDALMSLNDGGISYIRRSLRPLCNPELKRNQILQTLADIRQPLCQRLRAFYRTDDREEERRQKKQQIYRIFRVLQDPRMTQPRLGQLLHAFTITDTEIFTMYEAAARRFQASAQEVPQTSMETLPPQEIPDLEDWDPFSDAPMPQPAREQTDAALPLQDEAAFFAAHVESGWVAGLHALAEDTALQTWFHLPAQDFSILVSELATGASRLGLQQDMAQAFREAGSYINTSKERILRQQAGMAARILNDYVSWLGLHPHAGEAARTVHSDSGKSFQLFTPPPPVDGYPRLSEQRVNYADSWFGDWCKALYALVMDNVNFDGKQAINIEENSCLGRLLARLDAAAPA